MEASLITPDHQPVALPAEEFQYDILTPDKGHTRQQTPEELQEFYLSQTTDLMNKVVGDPETRADTLVFLDKSARPLAWIMRTFWDELAPQERNEHGELVTIPMPEMKFTNIDRLLWRADSKKEISDGGARPINESDIWGVRHVFDIGKENVLDGKKIVIIDEQAESGDTMQIAETLFKLAFPTSEVRTEPWIRHPYDRHPITSEKIYKPVEIPVWYPLKGDDRLPEDERGRGVYGPMDYHFDRSDAFRKRFPAESNQFLSSRPRSRRDLDTSEKARLNRLVARLRNSADPDETKGLAQEIDKLSYINYDEKSRQLRKEIGQMLIDFTNGKLLPVVNTHRETVQGMPMAEYEVQLAAKKQPKQRSIFN
jgi:hypothetical protein